MSRRSRALPRMRHWLPAAIVVVSALLALPLWDAAAAGPGGETAIVPHNDVADIYLTFPVTAPSFGNELSVMQQEVSLLEQEGYTVNFFYNSHEGTANDGTATPESFLSMARAAIVIIDTHGSVARAPHSNCKRQGPDKQLAAKGLYREWPSKYATGSYPPPTKWVVDPISCLSGTNDNRRTYGILVHWYDSPGLLVDAATKLLKEGTKPEYWQIVEGLNDEGVLSYGLLLDEAGIRHYFGNSQIDLLYGLFCHARYFSQDFKANSFFGVSATSCSVPSLNDFIAVWTRLLGHEGVARRSTTAAFAAGGFKEPLQLVEPERPLVLSPAIDKTSPTQEAHLTAGKKTQAAISFDTPMRPVDAKQLLEVRGCGVKLEGAHWADNDTKLEFTLDVPKHPPTARLGITVKASEAQAQGSGGKNGVLDGNEDPKGPSGVAPNGDDYLWLMTCGAQPLTVTVTEQGSYQMHDHATTTKTDVALSWTAATTIVFTNDKNGDVKRSYSLKASGTATAKSPYANESYSCKLSAGNHPEQGPVHYLAEMATQIGVSRAQLLSDSIDVLPFIPLQTSRDGSTVLKASGGGCNFDNNPVFTPTLISEPDSAQDWAEMETGFQTDADQLIKTGTATHVYTINDTLADKSTVKAKLVVTAKQSGG